MRDVFIYDALRTPRGKGRPGGSLYQVKPVHLLSEMLQAMMQRNPIPPSSIDEVIIGCVTPVGDQGFNIARTALLEAGLSAANGGMQINRYCPSGLEAVNLAAAKIAAGWENLAICGGLESMSRLPLGSDGGPLLFDPGVMMQQNYLPQGLSADLIATKEGFTREQLDTWALASNHRAAHAREQGYFAGSIVPIFDRASLPILAEDELIRPDTTMEKLAKLPPSFAKDGEKGFARMALHVYPELERIHYLHTAGNSSQLADGAALVLLADEETGKNLGLRPRARIVAASNASVDPTIMLTGPGVAVAKLLKNTGRKAADIDLWECNEAFASVVLKFQQDHDIPSERLNPNGGAIALGHPLGATGAMLLGTLLDEMERQQRQSGVVTLCGGAGLATATLIELV